MGSDTIGVPDSLGTSKLFLATPPLIREPRVCSLAVGDATATGNLVSAPPELGTLRCPREAGAGLVALLRDPPAAMIARARASMLALRLLSSVLTARGLVSTLILWESDEARFRAEKISSL